MFWNRTLDIWSYQQDKWNLFERGAYKLEEYVLKKVGVVCILRETYIITNLEYISVLSRTNKTTSGTTFAMVKVSICMNYSSRASLVLAEAPLSVLLRLELRRDGIAVRSSSWTWHEKPDTGLILNILEMQCCLIFQTLTKKKSCSLFAGRDRSQMSWHTPERCDSALTACVKQARQEHLHSKIVCRLIISLSGSTCPTILQIAERKFLQPR